MSSGCHVIFVDVFKKRSTAYITYMHDNSYPYGRSGVVAQLLHFNEWLKGHPYWGKYFGWYNGSCMAANWVYWCKKQAEKRGGWVTFGYDFAGVALDAELNIDKQNLDYIPLRRIEEYLYSNIEYLYFIYPSRDKSNKMNWYIVITNSDGKVIDADSLRGLVLRFATV